MTKQKQTMTNLAINTQWYATIFYFKSDTRANKWASRTLLHYQQLLILNLKTSVKHNVSAIYRIRQLPECESDFF